MKKLKHLFEFVLLIAVAAAAIFAFWSFYKGSVVPKSYGELIEKYSDKYSVPSSYVYAVVKCESDFAPNAVSGAGAVGLMQIMPETFTWLCGLSGSDYTPDMIADPDANLDMGVFYLSWLKSRFSSWDTVFAAYNAGHNRVRNWMEDPTIFKDGKFVNIPIKETRDYVEKVNDYASRYKKTYPELT